MMLAALHIIFFSVISISVDCSLLLHKNLEDETIIPAEIISNYLQKYVNCEEVFLSFSFSSSNVEQEYFQEDLFIHLMLDPKLENFSYNILDQVDQSRKENKHAINLILIDGSASLK